MDNQNRILNDNRYAQLFDYLSQIKKVDGLLTNITNEKIAGLLDVSASGVSQFLTSKTSKPKKMLNNFVRIYPQEYSKWPANLNTINRILGIQDAGYFLSRGRQAPAPAIPPQIQPSRPLHLAIGKPPISKPSLCVIPAASSAPAKQVPTSSANSIPLIKKNERPRLGYLANRAPIAISYRGIGEKDAAGILFDHMCMQRNTGYSTVVVVPASIDVAEQVKQAVKDALKLHPAQLPLGEKNADGKNSPPFISDISEQGLLIIPGSVRKCEGEEVRLTHEYRIIRGALNRGQPILGICAGSWRVWEQLFTWTKKTNLLNIRPLELRAWHEKNITLVDAKDHGYGGGMIRLDSMGTRPVYNKQVHSVQITNDSLLQSALGKKIQKMDVNSVHWKAANPAKPPLNITISAIAKENPSFAIKSRQGTLMQPEEDTVECFESELGTPILGVQWHPEGYYRDGLNTQLLSFMAKAGNAYGMKRKMLKQLQERMSPV